MSKEIIPSKSMKDEAMIDETAKEVKEDEIKKSFTESPESEDSGSKETKDSGIGQEEEKVTPLEAVVHPVYPRTMYLAGRQVRVTKEQYEYFHKLGRELNQLKGEKLESELSLDHSYWKKRNELINFVGKLEN